MKLGNVLAGSSETSSKKCRPVTDFAICRVEFRLSFCGCWLLKNRASAGCRRSTLFRHGEARQLGEVTHFKIGLHVHKLAGGSRLALAAVDPDGGDAQLLCGRHIVIQALGHMQNVVWLYQKPMQQRLEILTRGFIAV